MGCGGTTIVSRSTAERSRGRCWDQKSRQRLRGWCAPHRQTLPIGEVAARRFHAELPGSWIQYLHGYGTPAIIAAAVMGSGVNGCTVTLPQCSARAVHYHYYAGPIRPWEMESLQRFGREIRAASFAAIVRTAVIVALGLPYGRDGCTNSEAKVSKEYVESLMILAGHLPDELMDRAGKPLLSLLLRLYREGGREAVADKVQTILDWYTPRYVDNIIRVLGWYELFISDELMGLTDRRRQRRIA